MAGETGIQLTWLGEPLQVSGGVFVQVNQGAGEALHRYVLGSVGIVAGTTVVEGYCGTGVLGRHLARQGGQVVGIEADPQAVSEAKHNPPDGFRVVEGRVEELLADLLPADLVLLNPPRTGLDGRVPEILVRNPVAGVVYVSCDPATLARDLKRLGEAYRVQDLQSFDLFPQTAHVETVATLKGRGI